MLISKRDCARWSVTCADDEADIAASLSRRRCHKTAVRIRTRTSDEPTASTRAPAAAVHARPAISLSEFLGQRVILAFYPAD